MRHADAGPGIAQSEFDPVWYLEANSDVAQARVDPWVHYSQSGWREGRLAAPVQALDLDRQLWTHAAQPAFSGLQDLVGDETASRLERSCASWCLARWYASHGDWDAARQAISLFHFLPEGLSGVPHIGPFLLAAQAAIYCSSPQEVQTWIDRILLRFGPRVELDLLVMGQSAMVNEGQVEQGISQALSCLYTSQELSPVQLRSGTGARFDRLSGIASAAEFWVDQKDALPLVSVIMPVHNAAATLKTAVTSILGQDWPALELLLVDDGSQDDSLTIAQEFARQDSRVQVIETGSNMGAYCARNLGMAQAKGQVITVHDADDWSHPSKLRLQLMPLLEQPELQATVSHWVRADDDLSMSRWRMEPEGWVHRNVSSLMIRSGLRDQLGYWDRVRFNADTEYYYRIIAVFGGEAIAEVKPGVPLAWGRSSAGALTAQSGSHLRSHLWGLRYDYMQAAQYWHEQAPDALFMPQYPKQRAFRVPGALGPSDPAGTATDFDRLTATTWFDPVWYMSAYRDVALSHIGPIRHYLNYGAAEDRDPGPCFSASGYRLQAGVPEGQAALLHWISQPPNDPMQGGEHVVPQFPGKLAGDQGDRVLVCAHAAGKMIFGAERSFLDMLRRLRHRGKVPVVVVPRVHNQAYWEQLLALSAAVGVVPQIWRQAHHRADPNTVDILRGLIRSHQVQVVHVNTLVLNAPLDAARQEGCESVLHVRELPQQDPALCRSLGYAPEVLRRRLLQEVDQFVANSPLVAEWLDCPERVEVEMNQVDEALFELPFSPGPVLRLGLISSNISKKGIVDAAHVAQLMAARGSPVEILLIGPQTPDLEALMAQEPANMQAPGYASSPMQALQQVDVLLSLSHFAESFGRTVLEAMASGRPVICYDRGLPPWLVRSQERADQDDCGVVVPPDAPEMVAQAVWVLLENPQQLHSMSKAARARARMLNQDTP